jgi:flagellin
VDEVKEGFARTVDINGATVTIDKTDNQAAITKKLQEAGAESGVKVEEEKTTDPVTGVDTVTGYKLTPATVTSVDFDMGQTEVILPIEDVRAGTVNIEAPATINHDAQISADDTVDEIFAKLQTLASSSNILVSEIKDSSGTVTGYKLTSARNNIHTKVSFDNNSRTTVTIPLENVKTGNAGTVSVNNKNVTIDATDSQNAIYAKLQEAFEAEGLQVTEMTDANGTLTGYQVVGSSQKVTCSVDTDDIATTNEDGKDTDLRLITANDTNAATGLAYGEGFSDTTTYLTDGKKVTIHDLNGFEMIFEVDPEGDYQNLLRDTVDASGAVVALGAVSDPKQQAIVNLEMTDIGNMTLQVGAHENQVVDVRIPAATCEALYIDDLNLVRIGGADKAITALDAALSQVSDIRSRIGAYENRLDYAVTSLDATEENMESAISRLMDTDMAEEMSTYSNQNVLDQAAIAVLSQANDMPQQILQLLN